MRGYLKVTGLLLAVTALAAAPGIAQSRGGDDEILARLFDNQQGPAYSLTSEFTASLTLNVGAQYVITAGGIVRERKIPDQPRQVEAAVQRIQVPLLLRPVSGSLAGVIQQLVETQGDDRGVLTGHDVVILETRRDGTYRIGGIRRDIVDDAIARYQKGADSREPSLRRAVAVWLLTSPTMRTWIRRSGPPYAFGALMDDTGHLRATTVSYDWGEVANRVSYTYVGDIAAWNELTLDVAGTLSGLGKFTGHLEMRFANHRLGR